MARTAQKQEFVTDSGHAFVYMTDDMPEDGDVLISFDRHVYFAVEVKKVVPRENGHDLHFAVPVIGLSGSLRRTGDVIDYALRRFVRTDGPVTLLSVVTLNQQRPIIEQFVGRGV